MVRVANDQRWIPYAGGQHDLHPIRRNEVRRHLRISLDSDHPFRSKPITHFG